MDGSGTIYHRTDAKVEAFLSELTELSRKHAVAIGGQPFLFLMGWEDKASAYKIDAESRLVLD